MTADDRKKRLHRLELVYVRSPIYAVTILPSIGGNCSRARQLTKPWSSSRYKVPLMARGPGNYVLMPDHLYTFVATDDQKITLSLWMKSLKHSTSKILRRKRVVAPHWQETFFDHLLRNNELYSQEWNYVRKNPARAGLVKTAAEWPFVGEIFRLEYRSD